MSALEVGLGVAQHRLTEWSRVTFLLIRPRLWQSKPENPVKMHRGADCGMNVLCKVKSSNIQYLLTDRISQRNLPQWNGNGSWPKCIVLISVKFLVVNL